MKKHAAKVLLPLLFSCCFVCFGSLSVNAQTVGSPDTVDLRWIDDFPRLILRNSSEVDIFDQFTSGYYDGSSGFALSHYSFNNSDISGVQELYIGDNFNYINYTFAPEVFDYYFIVTAFSQVTDPSKFTFVPDKADIQPYNCSGEDGTHHGTLEDFNVTHYDNDSYIGFSVTGKLLDNYSSSTFSFVRLKDYDIGTLPADLKINVSVLAVEKGTLVNGDINQQILNRLDTLIDLNEDTNDKLDQIDETIKDQYSISDEDSDLGLSDGYHVLYDGFGSFLGTEQIVSFHYNDIWFSEPGEPVITFPGFVIDVQGESYRVWDDTVFDLRNLDVWFPGPMQAVRMVLLIVFYSAIINFSLKTFHDIIERG